MTQLNDIGLVKWFDRQPWVVAKSNLTRQNSNFKTPGATYDRTPTKISYLVRGKFERQSITCCRLWKIDSANLHEPLLLHSYEHETNMVGITPK